MENCSAHSAHQRAIEQHDRRLGDHGDEIDDLRDCVVRLTALQETYTAWQASADERIAALESKPSKRWETVSNYTLTAVIALVLGYLAAQIGLG